MTPGLLLLAACEGPVPLPPTRIEKDRPTGMMVRAPGVLAFIARPRAEGPHPAALLWVERIDDDARARALHVARGGEIALAVPLETDPDRARAYLAQQAGAVREICVRSACP